MNAENPSRLRFIVAGGGQDLFDVVIFQRAQSEELVSSRRNVVLGECFADLLLSMLVANLFRKMASVNLALRAENHGALQHIPQLANVARPGILLQQFPSRRSQSVKALSQLAIEVLHDFERQWHDILPALTQGRNIELHHIHAVVEVLAKSPL